MRYSDELIEEIRSRCDIVDVVGEHVRLKRSGSNYFGLCPFHNEKTGSFSVSPSRQMYHCFGCHKSGDVFSFEMEYNNSSFTEAVQILADRAGVSLPEPAYEPEKKEREDRKEKLLEVYRKAAGYYYYLLGTPAGRAGKAYLLDRGLSEETIRNFGLGFAGRYSNELYKYLHSLHYTDRLLADTGLFSVSEKKVFADRFWNRVMFPICDVRGRVIGFGGRVMGDGEPKYLNSPESELFNKRMHLFALHIARRTGRDRMLLCEGYMDVISLHQAGFTNAVASLGTALTPQQALLLKRYTKEVVLMYDSDGAGRNAAERAYPILTDAGLAVKVANMSPEKDPDEVIQKRGADALTKIIENAENGFLFTIRRLAENYDFDDPQARTDFAHAAAGRLLRFPDEIERENYTEEVCRRYRIDPAAMRRLLGRLAQDGYAQRQVRERTEPVRTGNDERVNTEEWFLSYLANADGAFEAAGKLIGPEDFEDPFLRTVAERLYAQLSAGEVRETSIIDAFTAAEDRNRAAGIFYRAMSFDTPAKADRAFTEIVLSMMRQSNAARMNRWTGDPDEWAAILRTKSLIEQYEREGFEFHISYHPVKEMETE